MTADPKFSRRALLASGVALSTAIAGCSGGGGSDTPAQSGDATATAEGTPTGTAQRPSDSTPSLSEFDYPEGATQGGIDKQTLHSTHDATVTESGSVTFTLERTFRSDRGENTSREMNRFSSGNTYREIEDSGETRYEWVPSDEDRTYVQLESGFETDYRIDNESPSNNEVTGLETVESLLFIATWGEAVAVVESGDGVGATYETTGLAPNLRNNSDSGPSSVEGSMTVSESGYVSELDLTINQTNGSVQEMTGTVSSLGETTAEAPTWLDTAREEGVQFTSSLTDGGTAFRLEMTNGNEIGTDARLSLSDSGGRGESSLPSALTVGDTLYLGLSQSSELLIGTDGTPDGARELGGFTRVEIYEDPFTVFVSDQELR